VITRTIFDPAFLEAICERGLTVTDLARRTGLSAATVSAAVRGRPVNLRTAVCLARTVAAAPRIEGLEAWIHAAGYAPTSVRERSPA
jgi:transcriptional regulator with XRE-family HTH domain